MSRNFDQIMRSKETDSWSRTRSVYNGTNQGGTVSISIPVSSGRDINYVLGVSVFSNVAGAKFEILNGTSYLFQMRLQSGVPFKTFFEPPLKCSEGTNCNFNIYGLYGTVSCNINGYTVT